MDNKYRKLFIIKQSKGCKFIPKMHQSTSGERAPPGPAGELMHFLRPQLSRNGGATSKGDGKGGEGIPPKVKVSRINTERRVQN